VTVKHGSWMLQLLHIECTKLSLFVCFSFSVLQVAKCRIHRTNLCSLVVSAELAFDKKFR
jgi:hypothetical protein